MLKTSIIITTCNRADDLRLTLASLGAVSIPEGMSAELLVVDNRSGDHTKDVVESCDLKNMEVRYFYEERPGKSHALNSAVAESAGDILLFTDDDVRFGENWVAGMCQPILSGEADAVRGTILLAPHLLKPWMTASLLARLAHCPELAPGEPVLLVGANMALSRRVFEKVPEFDTELGPGPRTNGWEDTLFSWQIEEAGYRLVAKNEPVVHYPLESRLTRKTFLAAARKGALGEAYLGYHWMHNEVPDPARRLFYTAARLLFWRVKRWTEWQDTGKIAGWENDLMLEFWRNWYFIQERKRPRNYALRGLVKLHPLASANNDVRAQGGSAAVNSIPVAVTRQE